MAADRRSPDDMFDFHEKLMEVVGTVSINCKSKIEIYELLASTVVFFYFEDDPKLDADKKFVKAMAGVLERGINNMRDLRHKSKS